jgi:hypothetical protein
MLYELVAHYPEMTAAIVLLLGVVVARVVQMLCTGALSALDERWARQSTSGATLLTPASIRYAGMVLFWTLVLLALALALSFLDPQSLGSALALLATFAGRVAVAALIVGAGHVLGLISLAGAARLVENAHLHAAIPPLAYGTVMLIAAITALAQLTIDTSFISQLLLILIGATAAALALAFAIGARAYVANLLAGRELGRYHIGERIRVGDTEGNIVAIRTTYAEVETAEGIVSLPASALAWQPVTRLGAPEPAATDNG